jgi:hypothetical protein
VKDPADDLTADWDYDNPDEPFPADWDYDIPDEPFPAAPGGADDWADAERIIEEIREHEEGDRRRILNDETR